MEQLVQFFVAQGMSPDQALLSAAKLYGPTMTPKIAPPGPGWEAYRGKLQQQREDFQARGGFEGAKGRSEERTLAENHARWEAHREKQRSERTAKPIEAKIPRGPAAAAPAMFPTWKPPGLVERAKGAASSVGHAISNPAEAAMSAAESAKNELMRRLFGED